MCLIVRAGMDAPFSVIKRMPLNESIPFSQHIRFRLLPHMFLLHPLPQPHLSHVSTRSHSPPRQLVRCFLLLILIIIYIINISCLRLSFSFLTSTFAIVIVVC